MQYKNIYKKKEKRLAEAGDNVITSYMVFNGAAVFFWLHSLASTNPFFALWFFFDVVPRFNKLRQYLLAQESKDDAEKDRALVKIGKIFWYGTSALLALLATVITIVFGAMALFNIGTHMLKAITAATAGLGMVTIGMSLFVVASAMNFCVFLGRAIYYSNKSEDKFKKALMKAIMSFLMGTAFGLLTFADLLAKIWPVIHNPFFAALLAPTGLGYVIFFAAIFVPSMIAVGKDIYNGDINRDKLLHLVIRSLAYVTASVGAFAIVGSLTIVGGFVVTNPIGLALGLLCVTAAAIYFNKDKIVNFFSKFITKKNDSSEISTDNGIDNGNGIIAPDNTAVLVLGAERPILPPVSLSTDKGPESPVYGQ